MNLAKLILKSKLKIHQKRSKAGYAEKETERKKKKQIQKDERYARRIHFHDLGVPAYRHVAKYGRIGDLEPQAYVEFNTTVGVQTDTGKDKTSLSQVKLELLQITKLNPRKRIRYGTKRRQRGSRRRCNWHRHWLGELIKP